MPQMSVNERRVVTHPLQISKFSFFWKRCLLIVFLAEDSKAEERKGRRKEKHGKSQVLGDNLGYDDAFPVGAVS